MPVGWYDEGKKTGDRDRKAARDGARADGIGKPGQSSRGVGPQEWPADGQGGRAGVPRRALEAGLGRLRAVLTGRQNGLESLERVLSEHKVRGSDYGGTRPVAIAQIRGSEGRSENFDVRFRSLKGHTWGKWMNVALARLKGVVLPVVELAQARLPLLTMLGIV